MYFKRNGYPAYRTPVMASNRRVKNPYTNPWDAWFPPESELVQPATPAQKIKVTQKTTAPHAEPQTSNRGPAAPQTEPEPVVEQSEQKSPTPTPANDTTDWEAIAKQQQAGMDNFKKRHQRRTDEAIIAERERLLLLILPVADNLARALSHNGQDESLRQGIELTQRELERILAAEGVTRLETAGQTFNPEWHEALAVLPDQGEPDTIIQEVEAGYMLGDKLLRPAKVIVAA